MLVTCPCSDKLAGALSVRHVNVFACRLPSNVSDALLSRQARCFAAYPNSQTRVTKAIQNIPRDVDRYFQGGFFRRIIWTTISYCLGYYAANMVSLAFGALAINDVVAAVTTLVVYEIISNAFYKAWPQPSLWLVFANFFKMGVATAFMADAIKLGN